MSSKARLEIAGMLQTYSPRGHPKNPWMRGEVGVGYFFCVFPCKVVSDKQMIEQLGWPFLEDHSI